MTLAPGIGASAALFALVDTVLLRPLPCSEPQRLVSLWETEGASRGAVAPANLADYRVPAFESLAAWHSVERDLSGEGPPEALFGQAVTVEFFAVLGVGPVRGRPFLPEETTKGEGVPAQVVLLHDRVQHPGLLPVAAQDLARDPARDEGLSEATGRSEARVRP